jgi:hypothetical protein
MSKGGHVACPSWPLRNQDPPGGEAKPRFGSPPSWIVTMPASVMAFFTASSSAASRLRSYRISTSVAGANTLIEAVIDA